MEGFVVYLTFFAISTFTIVEVEQELSVNLNHATNELQLVFLICDVIINYWSLVAVALQVYEVYGVMHMERSTFECYRKTRYPYVEMNVCFMLVLNVIVQFLRVVRRAMEGSDDTEYHDSMIWFVCSVFPICTISAYLQMRGIARKMEHCAKISPVARKK